MVAHPAPLGSFDYWQHTLTTLPAPKAQLDRLYAQGPELFLRVTAQQPRPATAGGGGGVDETPGGAMGAALWRFTPDTSR